MRSADGGVMSADGGMMSADGIVRWDQLMVG